MVYSFSRPFISQMLGKEWTLFLPLPHLQPHPNPTQFCMLLQGLAEDIPLNQGVKAACTLGCHGALGVSEHTSDWGGCLEERHCWYAGHLLKPITHDTLDMCQDSKSQPCKYVLDYTAATFTNGNNGRHIVIIFSGKAHGEDNLLFHYTFYFLNTDTGTAEVKLTA